MSAVAVGSLLGGVIVVATVLALVTLIVRQSTDVPGVHTSRPTPDLTSLAAMRMRSASGFTTDGTYAVGTSRLEVVEPAAAGGTGRRVLPTTVWYPARRSSGVGGSRAEPDRAHGPYPLVVFSQGYDLSIDAYAPLLVALTSAGFVVAAPAYPHTSPSDSGALDESDITNHPADLRAVITTLLELARASGSLLSGLIDVHEIGVVGHSDGGDVTLAVAADSCCRDPRVQAAVILSGAELTSFGGTYFSAGAPPLLVTQGSADAINPPACSAQIYDNAASPKYYLDLLGAQHKTPYVSAGPDREIVSRVITEFLDGELAGQISALTTLTHDGNIAGRSRLSHAAFAPRAAGGCPGAPG